jgi:hypothetical protein
MSKQVIIAIGDQDIRFTQDGKVAVLDVISVLSESSSAERIWAEFKRQNPGIECAEVRFEGGENLCVVDRETMEQVQDWLFDFIWERNRLKMKPFCGRGRGDGGGRRRYSSSHGQGGFP